MPGSLPGSRPGSADAASAAVRHQLRQSFVLASILEVKDPVHLFESFYLKELETLAVVLDRNSLPSPFTVSSSSAALPSIPSMTRLLHKSNNISSDSNSSSYSNNSGSSIKRSCDNTNSHNANGTTIATTASSSSSSSSPSSSSSSSPSSLSSLSSSPIPSSSSSTTTTTTTTKSNARTTPSITNVNNNSHFESAKTTHPPPFPQVPPSSHLPSSMHNANWVRSAYLVLVALVHPDKCVLPFSVEAFQILQRAYEVQITQFQAKEIHVQVMMKTKASREGMARKQEWGSDPVASRNCMESEDRDDAFFPEYDDNQNESDDLLLDPKSNGKYMTWNYQRALQETLRKRRFRDEAEELSGHAFGSRGAGVAGFGSGFESSSSLDLEDFQPLKRPRGEAAGHDDGGEKRAMEAWRELMTQEEKHLFEHVMSLEDLKAAVQKAQAEVLYCTAPIIITHSHSSEADFLWVPAPMSSTAKAASAAARMHRPLLSITATAATPLAPLAAAAASIAAAPGTHSRKDPMLLNPPHHAAISSSSPSPSPSLPLSPS
eukprot:CAMPEP_0175067840 /NCGR_PEP_ID=MMETSP0052_2-20121109/17326_1 /TAXON_ID=51329 ORGANISM="Polytomella parva, Strain SAG 63-3" /NCGR_SAMPLE_ID=MMETSP0052_2 /ASSEMBLY_ACC=CAM_ASM_000194 /LENGTH=545 /DNA_ID=CAMNT_0016334775 /DNA_START=751 /DNA_END=2384 /DNA_ORIENTATION=+